MGHKEEPDGIDEYKRVAQRLDFFFEKHFQRISNEIAGRKRVDWSAVIGAAASKNLTGPRGAPLSVQLCRRTWYRVVARMSARLPRYSAAGIQSLKRDGISLDVSRTLLDQHDTARSLEDKFYLADEQRKAHATDRLFKH